MKTNLACIRPRRKSTCAPAAGELLQTACYNITMVVIELDPETGKGQGTIVVGVDFGVNQAGQIVMDSPTAQPIRRSKEK